MPCFFNSAALASSLAVAEDAARTVCLAVIGLCHLFDVEPECW
jgi:hypothetical protein